MSTTALFPPVAAGGRLARWLPTDITTSGIEDAQVLMAPRTVDLPESGTAVALLTICIRKPEDEHWYQCLWSIAREPTNERVHNRDVEAPDQIDWPCIGTTSENSLLPSRQLRTMLLLPDMPVDATPTSRHLSRSPRTELGRRLREIRERIVASGTHLLSIDEVDRELAARRGEGREGE